MDVIEVLVGIMLNDYDPGTIIETDEGVIFEIAAVGINVIQGSQRMEFLYTGEAYPGKDIIDKL